MVTRTFRVYGADGHRQRTSFGPSISYGRDGWHIDERNSDKTGTNDYTEMVVTAETSEACLNLLDGQLSDGAFENSRYGKITEVVPGSDVELVHIGVWYNGHGFETFLNPNPVLLCGCEFRECVARCSVDDSYQKALFCHKLDDEFRDGDCIIFGGYDLPADETDFRNIMEDSSAFEFDEDTLKSAYFA